MELNLYGRITTDSEKGTREDLTMSDMNQQKAYYKGLKPVINYVCLKK